MVWKAFENPDWLGFLHKLLVPNYKITLWRHGLYPNHCNVHMLSEFYAFAQKQVNVYIK